MRHKLRKGPRAISHHALKALWCALDVDNNNSLHKEEMSGFFRRGAKAATFEAKPRMSGSKSADDVNALISRVGMGRALDSQPTTEMRTELAAKGVALPDETELTRLSTELNDWLEAMRHDERKGHATSWFNLFAEVDEGEPRLSTIHIRT